MVKSGLEQSGVAQFVFPGWGMSLDIYAPYLNLSRSSEIIDFGFFRKDGAAFNFSEWNFETDSDCFIVGHSLGALLALKAAIDCKKVKALVLFAPFARFTEDHGYTGQAPGAVEKMKLQADRNPTGLLKSFYRRMGFNCDIPEEINVDALRIGLDALLELDFRNILSDIDVPGLIVSGRNDLIVNSEMSGLVAGTLKRSKSFSFEDAGHAVPFTHCKESVDLIFEFLKDSL